MASKADAVWAIDIGVNSLKALRLTDAGGTVEVIGHANIQHGKILTGNGVRAAEREELVALTLRRFLDENDIGKDDIIVSVPSQNSFARFVKLPPVEAKRVPEIVKFEAAQQIPFDINDVQWDWQLMSEEGAAENRVGIFAIKNEVVTSVLEHFSRENLQVGCVQMSPMALYNYLIYDRPKLVASDSHATVVLNIGAENTDLVVCTKSAVWQRCISMGGNTFTKAIADAFKLKFEKAEKLKRTAPMSKYARQILQAMKPVFTDLASEVQRSLGFYKTSNPNTQITKIVALGGGTKMRGLLKYLQQSLQIPIERPDVFKRLTLNSDISEAEFHENTSDFGVVYGLGLQGLELARIESNLLPGNIARSMAWAGKAKHFTLAACLLLVVAGLSLGRTLLDKASYGEKRQVRQKIAAIIKSANTSNQKLQEQKDKGPFMEAMIKNQFDLFKDRDAIAMMYETILSALPNEKNNPDQKELYAAFDRADAAGILSVPRKERKQIFITNISVQYAGDVGTAVFKETQLSTSDKRRRTSSSRRTTRPKPVRSRRSPGGRGRGMADVPETTEQEITEGPGYLVTISGYSPYENIGELMDPVGVEDDQSSWGFITRLQYLDAVVDGNSAFKMYKKTHTPEHFMFEKGVVSPDDGDMPAGVGVVGSRYKGSNNGDGKAAVRDELVLIDPMTKEIISKIAKLKEDGATETDRLGKVVYQINDHWFRIKVKFLWKKDAPKEAPPIDPYAQRQGR